LVVLARVVGRGSEESSWAVEDGVDPRRRPRGSTNGVGEELIYKMSFQDPKAEVGTFAEAFRP
jgi:hypothetical protein